MKPILFNTEMVRAVLDGRKTVTRRAVKVNLHNGEAGWNVISNKHTGELIRVETYDEWEDEVRWINPPYLPGDILYVRETWSRAMIRPMRYLYKTNCPEADGLPLKWHPSIHMPKEAARIFLRVTDVRVERLQDIDGEGIKAEGTQGLFGATRGAFAGLWNRTLKGENRTRFAWAMNPWVWVIEFERCERPEE